MILVCAAGLHGSNADDVAKEVAIYRAHKARADRDRRRRREPVLGRGRDDLGSGRAPRPRVRAVHDGRPPLRLRSRAGHRRRPGRSRGTASGPGSTRRTGRRTGRSCPRRGPIVDRDDEAPAFLDDIAGDVGVLGGESLDGVDDEDRHVGAADRLQRPERREALRGRSAGDLAPAPDARGVDEDDLAPAPLQRRVDRVAGRAGHLADDRPVLPEKRVEERRLADVRAADEGDRRGLVVLRGGGDLGVPAGGDGVGLVSGRAVAVLVRLLVADDERLEVAGRDVAGPVVGFLLAGLSRELLRGLGRERPDDRVEQVAGAPAVRRARSGRSRPSRARRTRPRRSRGPGCRPCSRRR